MKTKSIEMILEKLLQQAQENNYRGIDPNDYAGAKLRVPGKLAPKISFLNKVSPINFRSLLGIGPSENSKSNALFLHAMANFDHVRYEQEINKLIAWFKANRSNEFTDFSVGFAFEMTLSRYSSGPGKTSLIISLFTMYAFLASYRKRQDSDLLDMILSFENILHTQWMKFESETECWYSYLPNQKDEVYNATAKVGRFYAELYAIQPEERYKNTIVRILAYLGKVQREDGTWGYSVKAGYSDNFHTAFVLESIFLMNKVAGNEASETMFSKGMDTYKTHCFDGPRALHFHTQHKPTDIRSNIFITETRDTANAIILFSKTGELEKAKEVLQWTIHRFYDSEKGYFHFFENKVFRSRIKYIRWQSWMALAISEYLLASAERMVLLSPEQVHHSNKMAV